MSFLSKMISLTGFILFFWFHSWSQGLINPITEIKDTSILGIESEPIKKLIFYSPISSGFLFPLEEFKINIPDFKSLLNNNWSYYRSFSNSYGTIDGLTSHTGLELFLPVFNSVTLFNEATYRISNRLAIGGTGFGARSIFSAPLPGSLTRPSDIRGASMFFQYKISPKFKIETRVNVTQGPGY